MAITDDTDSYAWRLVLLLHSVHGLVLDGSPILRIAPRMYWVLKDWLNTLPFRLNWIASGPPSLMYSVIDRTRRTSGDYGVVFAPHGRLAVYYVTYYVDFQQVFPSSFA